jgi:NAD(P)H-nitrite reductase large subunit
MRYVIIGNGAAGGTAAETIRRLDPEGTITIISDEEVPFYSRLLLAEFIAGAASEEELFLRTEDSYAALGIELLLRSTVVRLEPEEKRILLADGQVLSYDRLLIATGASPMLPKMEGLEGPGVFSLRTIKDAKEIVAASQNIERAVVIGGGLVGLHTVFGLQARGLAVIVVEMLPHVLPQQLDPRAAEILGKAIEAKGVQLILGQTVEKILRRDGTVEGVLLADGQRVECGLVVVAAGVRPNIALAQEAGLEVGEGILVDGHLQTSLPDVYAAGDVAETMDPLIGQRTLSAVWPLAVEQGRVAGYNMAGEPREYEGALRLLNSVEFAGIPIISVGLIRPEGNAYEISVWEGKGSYRKLIFREDRLVGVILLGEIEKAGIYTALIRQQIDIGKIREELSAGTINYGHLLRLQVPEVEAYAA